MVILFLAFGAFFGAVAASIALWSGGSFLFALLCYSVFGTLGALVVVFAAYLRSEANENGAEWSDRRKSNEPVSA